MSIRAREPRAVSSPVDPFLKWAGGKRRLREQILDHLPPLAVGRRYFEPFLGGGAVFFALRPDRAVLTDANPNLIDAFCAVRDEVDSVIARLARLHNNADEYYRLRRARPRTQVARAARFIYLNKTCFNGLYRENLLGEFNVPFGRHGPNLCICDEPQLRAASEALQTAELRSMDFGGVISRARAGDVLYLDPPYTVAHSNNGFVEYNARVFNWEDQARLASAAARLVGRGAHVVVSNAYHPSILELYRKSGRFEVVELDRWSTVAGSSAKRMPTREIILVGRG